MNRPKKVKPKAQKRASQTRKGPKKPGSRTASTSAPTNEFRKYEEQLEKGRNTLEKAYLLMRQTEIESPSKVENKKKKTLPVRFVSKAPPPITPVESSWVRPKPEPNRMPQVPPYYSDNLITPTKRIMAEAIQKFPLRTDAPKFCKFIIAKLTPEFRAAIENGNQRNRFLPQQAILSMDSLITILVRTNSDSYGAQELEGTIESSDELQDFYREMERPIDQPLINATVGSGDASPSPKSQMKMAGSRKDPSVATRRCIVKNHPMLPAEGLCAMFDSDNVPLTKKMQEAKTWSKAYLSDVYRHAIDVLIYRDRKASS